MVYIYTLHDHINKEGKSALIGLIPLFVNTTYKIGMVLYIDWSNWKDLI